MAEAVVQLLELGHLLQGKARHPPSHQSPAWQVKLPVPNLAAQQTSVANGVAGTVIEYSRRHHRVCLDASKVKPVPPQEVPCLAVPDLGRMAEMLSELRQWQCLACNAVKGQRQHNHSRVCGRAKQASSSNPRHLRESRSDPHTPCKAPATAASIAAALLPS